MRKKTGIGPIEILIVLIVVMAAIPCRPGTAGAATQTLNFAWEQAAADTASVSFGGWKLYGKTQSETNSRLLATINYAGSQQATYTASQPIESPDGAETAWTFYLTSFDKAGNESAPSAQVSWTADFAPPTVPLNLRITVVPAGN
jgi:hypothetical protein